MKLLSEKKSKKLIKKIRKYIDSSEFDATVKYHKMLGKYLFKSYTRGFGEAGVQPGDSYSLLCVHEDLLWNMARLGDESFYGTLDILLSSDFS